MSCPRPGYRDYTVIVGDVPEHREWTLDTPYYHPDIHPTAQLNAYVTIDAGLHAPTRIGARAFLMKHVHIGHDAQIGADCELAPGTVIGGHATLEDGVRCGINASVKPFVTIGAGARIGMGAVVIHDVPPGETWAGNPAHNIHDDPIIDLPPGVFPKLRA